MDVLEARKMIKDLTRAELWRLDNSLSLSETAVVSIYYSPTVI